MVAPLVTQNRQLISLVPPTKMTSRHITHVDPTLIAQYSINSAKRNTLKVTERSKEKKNMVRHYKKKKKKKRELLGWRKWEDLESDLLALIFSKMKTRELVFILSWVCHSWRLVCWDMLVYKTEGTLDLIVLKRLQKEVGEDYNSIAMRLMRVLKSIACDEDKLGCVTTMIFHQAIQLSDRHLVFLAERSPRLKRLCLLCAMRITGRGFSRAIRNWKGIEEMSIGPLHFGNYVHIIKEIGINCKKLQVICFCEFNMDMDVAPVILENLRDLKELRLQNLYISRLGLRAILSKCKPNVKVVISHCISFEGMPRNFFECWEIRKIKVGSDSKWSIGTEEEFNLNSLLELLWQRN